MKQKDEIVLNNAIFPKVDVENILQKQEHVIFFTQKQSNFENEHLSANMFFSSIDF